MRLLTILIAIAALSTPAHAESTTAEPATPTVSSQLAHEQFLFEVTSHLYRWYMDEIDVVRGTRDKDTFVFWTRPLKVALDEGDKSLLGEVVLPVLSIAVRVKKADYTIEELDATIRNKRFKIINVARITVPDAMPAEYTKVEVERADMRAYLFKARNEARFPDDALLTRIRLAARKQLRANVKEQGEALPAGKQVIHLAPLSPVANETWIFWETGRVLLRFASDIDLDNPTVWEHEDLAVKMYDLDEQVVVSLDEVAGSNAYLTRDQVGRALYNCVVLGKRLELDPKDIPEE